MCTGLVLIVCDCDWCEGMIPQMWQRYTIPAGTTVINWIIDFNDRVKQLHAISQASQQGGAAALKVLTLLSVCKISTV